MTGHSPRQRGWTSLSEGIYPVYLSRGGDGSIWDISRSAAVRNVVEPRTTSVINATVLWGGGWQHDHNPTARQTKVNLPPAGSGWRPGIRPAGSGCRLDKTKSK
eukprot:9489446-Pyramimonas_sp.AAC.1